MADGLLLFHCSIDGLSDEQLVGLMESSVNPMVWAIGHCAHFYETMVLRLLQPGLSPWLSEKLSMSV